MAKIYDDTAGSEETTKVMCDKRNLEEVRSQPENNKNASNAKLRAIQRNVQYDRLKIIKEVRTNVRRGIDRTLNIR